MVLTFPHAIMDQMVKWGFDLERNRRMIVEQEPWYGCHGEPNTLEPEEKSSEQHNQQAQWWQLTKLSRHAHRALCTIRTLG